jgi:hypothetical protein
MQRLMKRALSVCLVMGVSFALSRLWPATLDADRARPYARSVSSPEVHAAPRTRVAALGRLAPKGDVINVGAAARTGRPAGASRGHPGHPW